MTEQNPSIILNRTCSKQSIIVKINNQKMLETDYQNQEIVYLNVGGRMFQTTRLSLNREPQSKLAAILVDLREAEDGDRDKQHLINVNSSNNLLNTNNHARVTVFIDRNPDSFENVLEYLRNGSLAVLPQEEMTLRKLLADAKALDLHGLQSFIEENLLWREQNISVWFSHKRGSTHQPPTNNNNGNRCSVRYELILLHIESVSQLAMVIKQSLEQGIGKDEQHPIPLDTHSARDFTDFIEYLKLGFIESEELRLMNNPRRLFYLAVHYELSTFGRYLLAKRAERAAFCAPAFLSSAIENQHKFNNKQNHGNQTGMLLEMMKDAGGDDD